MPLFVLSLRSKARHAVGSALAGIDLGGIAAVAYIAFAATTVGWGLWAYLMRAYSAGTVAPFSLLVPVFGLGFAALLLGEALTWRTVIAALLVVSRRAADPAGAADFPADLRQSRPARPCTATRAAG